MITLHFIKGASNIHSIRGFWSDGHAHYARRGDPDIVCSAISVLTINFINSLYAICEEEITDKIICDINKDNEFKRMKCIVSLIDSSKPKTSALLDSFYIGTRDVAKTYGKEYVNIVFEDDYNE